GGKTSKWLRYSPPPRHTAWSICCSIFLTSLSDRRAPHSRRAGRRASAIPADNRLRFCVAGSPVRCAKNARNNAARPLRLTLRLPHAAIPHAGRSPLDAPHAGHALSSRAGILSSSSCSRDWPAPLRSPADALPSQSQSPPTPLGFAPLPL